MRTTAVVVGLLFLTSTAAFAASAHVAGALLVAYTGLAVAGIGIALFPVLRPHGAGLATGYLVLRTAEGLTLLAAALYLATSGHPVTGYEPLVYAFSGAGGLVLSGLLLRSGLVPKWLAVLGVVGYAALLTGVVSELAGVSELDSGPGLAFYVPGGLFELVFPILLLAKGFTRTSGGVRR
ncbi:DUF4386 family protein [Actinophytocola algeriensis]|jgi:hypothetical protein|nr:DUF4386 family protein [Actinophytocola algeriensis]MBE1475225.1 hypothetical protein [Actinophytocola algeriensis]